MSTRLTETRRWIADYRERERVEAVPNLLDRQSWEQPLSATDTWRERSLVAIRRVAESQETFTVEAVPFPPTVDNRARGAALKAASRYGWITADGWTNGDRSRHGRPVIRWRSRLLAA
jgi:hypothetical protein